MIIRQNISKDFPHSNTILKPSDIINARQVVKDVYIDEKIERYIIDIVFSTRIPKDYKLEKFVNLINYGASPRASINLAMASKAYAFIKRRGYVIPEDVESRLLRRDAPPNWPHLRSRSRKYYDRRHHHRNIEYGRSTLKIYQMRSIVQTILLLISLEAFSQLPVFIGMNKDDVAKVMAEKYPQFAQSTDFKNSTFKYLKFMDRTGDETLLVFLSDDDICTLTKLMTGYDNEETRIGELNKNYKKAGSDKWEFSENEKSYVVEMRKEEWYITIVVKPKK